MLKTLILAAGLAATSLGTARAQYRINPTDTPQVRAWKQHANSGYRGPNLPRPYMPAMPSNQARSFMYYRGPGGEVVRRDQLPPGWSPQQFRYLGTYGPGNYYHGR